MEKREQVKTILVKMICNVCRYGEMIPTGTVLPTHPMQYPHKCDTCETIETYYKTYPATEYEYKQK